MRSLSIAELRADEIEKKYYEDDCETFLNIVGIANMGCICHDETESDDTHTTIFEYEDDSKLKIDSEGFIYAETDTELRRFNFIDYLPGE